MTTPAPRPPSAVRTTAPGTAYAKPIVTYAAWSPSAAQAQVAAYVEGLDTGSATCTLTLTRATVRRTVTKAAISSASTMQCGTMVVPGSQLQPGTWDVTVGYASAARAGTTNAGTVTVTA